MTAVITWADGVVSVAGPPIMSDCSASGCAVMSGLLSEGSPSHATDGLNNLSKKMLGGLHLVLLRCVPGRLLPDCFLGLYGETPVPRTELTFLGRHCDKLPFLGLWRRSRHLFGISRGLSPRVLPGVECPWILPSGDHVEGPCIQLHCWSPCTYWTVSPVGDVKTTPAPSPANILEPSKCMVQFEYEPYSLGSSASVHSATKSAKACDLIARRGL